MRILGIVGSPHRNGLTAQLVERCLQGAKSEGGETEIVFLADYDLAPCTGCGGGCFQTAECRHSEQANQLSRKLQHANAIVFGAPVYCWQLNGLSALFIDRVRLDTGSVIAPSRNRRVALGITVAGGSGTGCILALQALYRYFCNWGYLGQLPLPVTRFNYEWALEQAEENGKQLPGLAAEAAPFNSFAQALAHYETLPYMKATAIDELLFIVDSMRKAFKETLSPGRSLGELDLHHHLACEALVRGNRASAAYHLDRAYNIGRQMWPDA